MKILKENIQETLQDIPTYNDLLGCNLNITRHKSSQDIKGLYKTKRLQCSKKKKKNHSYVSEETTTK